MSFGTFWRKLPFRHTSRKEPDPAPDSAAREQDSASAPTSRQGGATNIGRDHVTPVEGYYLFGFLAAGAILGGLLQRNPTLLALGQVSLVMIGLAYLHVRYVARRIHIVRRHLRRACFEDEIQVTLRVTNLSLLGSGAIELRDHFPASLYPQRIATLPWIPSCKTSEARYHAMCDRRRGAYRLGPVRFAVHDPLGIFRCSGTRDVRTHLTVLPPTFPIDASLSSFASRFGISSETFPVPGHSSTFLSTREYQPGDSIRRIHWRASARWGKWIMKEFEDHTTRHVTVFLDQDRSICRGIGGRRAFEDSVRVAASICLALLDQGWPVQLIGAGSRPTFLSIGSGPAQAVSLLETLAVVQPDGEVPFPTLIEENLDRIDPGATCVLLIHPSLRDPEGIQEAARALRIRGARIVAVAIDSYDRGENAMRSSLLVAPDFLFRFRPPATLQPETASVGETA